MTSPKERKPDSVKTNYEQALEKYWTIPAEENLWWETKKIVAAVAKDALKAYKNKWPKTLVIINETVGVSAAIINGVLRGRPTDLKLYEDLCSGDSPFISQKPAGRKANDRGNIYFIGLEGNPNSGKTRTKRLIRKALEKELELRGVRKYVRIRETSLEKASARARKEKKLKDKHGSLYSDIGLKVNYQYLLKDIQRAAGGQKGKLIIYREAIVGGLMPRLCYRFFRQHYQGVHSLLSAQKLAYDYGEPIPRNIKEWKETSAGARLNITEVYDSHSLQMAYELMPIKLASDKFVENTVIKKLFRNISQPETGELDPTLAVRAMRVAKFLEISEKEAAEEMGLILASGGIIDYIHHHYTSGKVFALPIKPEDRGVATIHYSRFFNDPDPYNLDIPIPDRKVLIKHIKKSKELQRKQRIEFVKNNSSNPQIRMIVDILLQRNRKVKVKIG